MASKGLRGEAIHEAWWLFEMKALYRQLMQVHFSGRSNNLLSSILLASSASPEPRSTASLDYLHMLLYLFQCAGTSPWCLRPIHASLMTTIKGTDSSHRRLELRSQSQLLNKTKVAIVSLRAYHGVGVILHESRYSLETEMITAFRARLL